jgi:hypothetical protein
VREFELLSHRRRCRFICQCVPQRSGHPRQRGSKFLTDVRKERRFGAVEFPERFGSLTLLGMCARINHGRGNLCAD